jgi:alkylhydroperoxidase family enzyme
VSYGRDATRTAGPGRAPPGRHHAQHVPHPEGPDTGVCGAVLSAYARRTWGQVPDVAHVLWHNRRVLRSVFGFENRVRRWKALDAELTCYARMASAGVIGCSWCLDYGYFPARNDGVDLGKVRQVPRWRESGVFGPLERDVLEYAEAVSTTPLTVTDGMVARLVEQLGAPAVVELTQVVALENMRSRFNCAAGLQSQGFSDACELPLAAP